MIRIFLPQILSSLLLCFCLSNSAEAASTGDSMGGDGTAYLEIDGGIIRIPVEDISKKFSIGDIAPLIESTDHFYIVILENRHGEKNPAAVPRENRRGKGTGWITKENQLVFGGRTTTRRGHITLTRRDIIEVEREFGDFYQVELVRHGHRLPLKINKPLKNMRYVFVPSPIIEPEIVVAEEDISTKKTRTRKPRKVRSSIAIVYPPPQQGIRSIDQVVANARHGNEIPRTTPTIIHTNLEPVELVLNFDEPTKDDDLPDATPTGKTILLNPEDQSTIPDLASLPAITDPEDASTVAKADAPTESVTGVSDPAKKIEGEAAPETVVEAGMLPGGASEVAVAVASPPAAFPEKASGVTHFLLRNNMTLQILLLVIMIEGFFIVKLNKDKSKSAANAASAGSVESFTVTEESVSMDFEVTEPALVGVFSGSLQGIPIQEVIQFLHSAHETGKLNIRNDNKVSFLLIDKGELIDAHHHNHKALRAVNEVLKLKEGEFSFEPGLPDGMPRNIKKPTMSILLESSRISDEENAALEEEENPFPFETRD